jgi:hypothetical protein
MTAMIAGIVFFRYPNTYCSQITIGSSSVDYLVKSLQIRNIEGTVYVNSSTLLAL